MAFQKVTAAILATEEKFRLYLLGADIQPSRTEGSFVGNYEVAPDEFRKFGIVLPKGGMIIPGIDPKTLRLMVKEPDRLTEEVDRKVRQEDAAYYLNDVLELLAKSGITDIRVVEKEGRGSSLWRKSFFVRDEEIIFDLHSEEEPYDPSLRARAYESWRVSFTQLKKVEAFLLREAELIPSRALFRDRLLQLKRLSQGLGHMSVGEDGWARSSVEFLLYQDEYSGDINYFGKRCSVDSVHLVIHRNKRYRLSEEDVSALERVVQGKEAEVKLHLERLWNLFVAANGVFTKIMVAQSCFNGCSLFTGKPRHDEWMESIYFICGEQLSREEYDWFQSRLDELPLLGSQFYRFPNDTNEIKSVIYPRDNNVLDVYGKTGRSRRGVDPLGNMFYGRPEDCKISPHSRWAKEWRLNGKELAFIPEDFFQKWNEPIRRAQRAFEEAGIRPEVGEVEALAEAYSRLGK